MSIITSRLALTGSAALIAGAVFAVPASAGETVDGPPTPQIHDIGCTEFDRYQTLTPNDTLTLITAYHNPDQAQGFVVVYAVDEAGEAISFNHLIGSQMVINGIDRFEYSVNPVDFRSPVEDGGATDLDSDDVRDLDGSEYETCPDELLVPRFIGQTSYAQMPTAAAGGPYSSSLILIDLNSGANFNTTVDFLTYNDNEEVFSGEYTFNCWENPRLLDISGIFAQGFLKDFTGHNPNESVGGRETGWFRFQGALANSVNTTIADPAIYGVFVERVGGYAVADLPFEIGSRDGHVLPRVITGDNSEAGDFDGAAAPVERRHPGSLLLYPEFNNLYGELTLLTITNESATDEVRVHFVYYGKYGN
ncbi:MAG: hypothetical protein H6831_12960 [Planctomycetes bacterium]|nr:hypothetical protein [Planctomycetota bacterium]MCB9905308.1 hypothetical protein [Planctomycetota bacterium]